MLEATLTYGRAQAAIAAGEDTATKVNNAGTHNNGELQELRKEVKELGSTIQTLAARIGVPATTTHEKTKGNAKITKTGKNTDKGQDTPAKSGENSEASQASN